MKIIDSVAAMEHVGVDIIGFPKGKLGIGDQVRSVIRLALENNLKVNLLDCAHASDNIHNDHIEFDSYITNTFKYPIRIYSLTEQHVAALIYRYGIDYFNNSNNIICEYNRFMFYLNCHVK